MDTKEINSGLAGKTVLLTGATGFIGSNLLKRLAGAGCKTHILLRKTSAIWRIESYKKDYTCHTADLTNSKNIKRLIEKIRPDVVFHLAAYGVNYKEQDVHTAIDVNISASINLFESFSALQNSGRFVYTGTCFEYGARNKPISEDELQNPTGIYGITKAASVNLLSIMSKQNSGQNATLVVLRPFGVFGESEAEYRLFPHLMGQLKKGEPVKMTGGEQIRDYVYIDDLVDAYMQAATVLLEKKSEIINLGSGKGVSLKDIALTISRQMHADSNLLQFGALPYRADEMMYLVADAEKARRVLGWMPKTSLEEGIKKMLAWYDDHGGDTNGTNGN